MQRRLLPGIVTLLLSVLIIALTISSSAQTATRKPPTAPQVAMQKKAKGKKGVMRGTTQYDRWQAAIKNADRRAVVHRTGKKGVK